MTLLTHHTTYILKNVQTIIEPYVPQTMIIEDEKGIANSTTKILIICHSAVENFMERTTIRETWGSAMDFLPIMLIFILGKVNDFNTWLNSNTVSELEYISKGRKIECNIRFLRTRKTKNPLIQRKIHNEALLNNDLLQEKLYRHIRQSITKDFIAEKHPFTIFGKSLGPNSPVHRLINSNETSDNKWTVPKYVYSNDFFPNAISGSGYFFDIEAGLCLYRRSLDTSLINLEDIYITVSNVSEYKKTSIKNFGMEHKSRISG
ncbi:B3GALT1 [Lepeophtheirus salmonis]|uniref:Hexosyltransferase n=1 Tax=Lepeophtheirus salmonis TaxID=72036 RepID=A0A7R8CMI0_LEPSM|nr:B3GALT1 [Lepeophtheirus salmonis]CAF2822228.1 B3GALT1 [Lepeophtheirus salmonis]